MKVAILTLGTRGDVEPYAVLGKALQQRGHEVILSTSKNFEDFVLSFGINFLPVEADFQAMLDSEEGKKMMKGNPLAIRRNLHKWIYPLITESLSTFYQLSLESDIVLYHVKTLADCFADQFPDKMIRASVLPIIEPTSAFPNPALSGLPIPSFLNKLTYYFFNLSIRLLSNPIGVFRERFSLPKKFKTPPIKNIYGLSAAFLPIPKEFPSNSVFTGFWTAETEDVLTPELYSFLTAGEPPLVITFGSMPFRSKFDLQQAILNLVQLYSIRVVVVKGWGLKQTDLLETNNQIMVVDAAPYSKLFPLAKAIVHHGGIGTTAACLKAGKPFMICPILYPMGDQLFWGKYTFQKGLSVRPCPLRKLTASLFITRVHELLSNKLLYDKAAEMQALLDKENGATNASLFVEKHWDKICNNK